jgi:hypothetical protein
MFEKRSGCLTGLLKLFLLDALFDFLQEKVGFGRGCSCTGVGCGLVLFILFIGLSCSVLAGIDWTRLF